MTTPSHLTQQRAERIDYAISETIEAVPLCRRIASKLQLLRRGQNGHKRVFESLPQPSKERLEATLNDAPVDTDVLVVSQAPNSLEKEKTVL